ncbi:hypothetical protein PM3016_6517 [Paenibacillus mucilaginosus 3016]|uniref:Uncharacterized protein n=1 Tax=Paenibacillus mucilaginosus 3016 TaxID=1116391 RepID=H6NIS5_9BACL|nr:hypothetical protein [Paenibacillus mucilaginosus]AFC33142.1 hypothetical protein PM3016_6517 [Paenibacillus mucilaginosus 3016]WFA21574.1 hypothetical protein ERY13_32410 [Paenibacillus mucilaginosus]
MMIPIEAYFHTENDAEDVRIKLQAYPVDSIEVGELAEPLDRGVPLLLPFALAGGTTGTATGAGYLGGVGAVNTGADAAGAYVGLRTADDALHDRDGDGRDDRELRYVLTANIGSEAYEEVVDLLRRSGAHVHRRS